MNISALLTAFVLSSLIGVAANSSAPPGQEHGQALNSPACVKAPEARNEQDGDEVLGVGRNGDFCAYPLRLMAYHRVVNDHLGGPPILVAYDPDSAAGAVFDPVVDGRTLNFDPSGSRDGVPVLQDRETHTVWSLLTGEGIEGALQGRKLAPISSLLSTWQEWKSFHKDTWVLKEDPAQSVHYVDRTTPALAAVPAGVLPAKVDRRLPASTLVLGVQAGGHARAYVISRLEKGPGVVNDVLGGRRIAVLYSRQGRSAAAYEVIGSEDDPQPVLNVRDVGSERIFFVTRPYEAWNIAGMSLTGHTLGIRPRVRLQPLTYVRCRWYAWSAAHPQTDIARLPKVASASRRQTGMARLPKVVTASNRQTDVVHLPKVSTAPGRLFTAFRGALVKAAGFGDRQARQLIGDDYNAVAFDLSSGGAGSERAVRSARAAGLRVLGWIQIARDEEAVRLHPEWMHTPQHTEWLRATDHSVDRAVDQAVFSDTIQPGAGHGLRYAVYPWVCVNNRAVFDYEAARVRQIIASAPKLDGLFLCDIQGAPMGCGCGNPLCRSWDNSPGSKIAPAPYQHPDVYFSKEFATAIQRDNPTLPIVPVLCEECENGIDVGPAANPDLEGPCHEIPCAHPCSLDYYPGMLRAFAGDNPVGLLAFYRLFRRTGSEYGSEAAWITGILQRVHKIVPAQPVIAVLQGWSGSPAQRAVQKQRAREGGAAGYLMALTYVRESWEAKKIDH